MSKVPIFVSYRRQDSPGSTGRLCDKLERHFGDAAVFRDIESIEAGADFAETIQTTIAAASVMLVIIGPRWLDVRDADGRLRLEEPKDYVRLEIAIALRRGIPIIPVLVEGAVVPDADALPHSIEELAKRQAHEISEERWQYDTDRLVAQIERYVPSAGRAATAAPAGPGLDAAGRALIAYAPDLLELLTGPRRGIIAHLQRPDAGVRASVFFIVSHLAVGWLILLDPAFVESVWRFILTSVPLGLFHLGVSVVLLHLSARTVKARSNVRDTMIALAYMQSVFLLLYGVGVVVMWSGLELGDRQIGEKLAPVVMGGGSIEERVVRANELLQAAMTPAFLVAYVVAAAIWLFSAGWLAVAATTFKDVWAVTPRRALAAGAIFSALVLAGSVLLLLVAML